MHPSLAKVAQVTQGTRFENQLWLVGGAVRDQLLGLDGSTDADFDIVLEGDAVSLATHLRETGASSIEPVVYPRFGTAMVRIDGSNVELVTARRESYEASSRKPHVEPATLQDDALRRDFTANTLMRNLHSGELRDPLGVGMADLRSRVLRTPLDPNVTFRDDPLRMLRAVRFKWKLGFTPAPGLYESIVAEVERLDIVSEERVRDEWVKMLLHPTASDAMRDLMELGLLDRFAPEFRAMKGVDQGHYHHLDVWEHTLLVVDNLNDPTAPSPQHDPLAERGRLTLVLAALLHDVGKPGTRSIDAEGNVRFFGHETVGAEIAERMLRRLKFSNEDVAPVISLVKNHMRLGSFTTFTATAARRLIRDMGDLLEPLFDLVQADAAALRPGVRAMDLSPIRARVTEVRLRTPTETLESPLSGNEIMALTKLDPGPEVGRLKHALLDEVLEGRIAPGDKDAARDWLKRHSVAS